MTMVLRPTTEDELRDAIAAAASGRTPLELVGAGTKRGFGRPVAAARVLDLSGLAGITLYQPEELVLTARAGTRLAEIDSALAERNQMLAFEPPDLGPLYGAPAAAGTLGGALACNLAGPRRPKAGAARDHVLGLRAVTGRGEVVAAGGRVVKNVTGYDLCKLLAGSFGTLAAFSEITMKVLPAGARTRTVLCYGLDPDLALDAMARALAASLDISAAAYLPDRAAARSAVGRVRDPGVSVVAFRLEGPEPSVLARNGALRHLLADFGPVEELHFRNSCRLWAEIAVAALLPEGGEGEALWRLSVPPASGVAVARALEAQLGAKWYLDWGGGLIWLRVAEGADAAHEPIRAALAATGGHATLMRAAEAIRATVPVFHPPAAGIAALSARIKDAFDPLRILNPGRMYEGM